MLRERVVVVVDSGSTVQTLARLVTLSRTACPPRARCDGKTTRVMRVVVVVVDSGSTV